jgi:hypothetical protein
MAPLMLGHGGRTKCAAHQRTDPSMNKSKLRTSCALAGAGGSRRSVVGGGAYAIIGKCEALVERLREDG